MNDKPRPEPPRWQPPAFLHASPAAQARRYAINEIRGCSNPTELRWLHDNPVLWGRALTEIIETANSHSAEQRANLAKLRSPAEANGMPTPAYLAAKSEFEQAARRREHFRTIVRQRLNDVKAVIGVRRVDQTIVGELVVDLHRFAYLIETDDAETARHAMLALAERLVSEKATAP